jgi:hypothetical protein
LEPTPEVLAAAETTRRSLRDSPVWEPALVDADMRAPVASIEPLRTDDIHYFLFEFKRGLLVTARFVLAPDGALLEAEGIKHPLAALTRFLDDDEVRWWAAGRSLRQVWRPCSQSTTRLRPFWEVSVHGRSRYIRADGVVFDRLTINAGRG